MKRVKKNNKGFSLVELIIAVVILGIVVIPLMQAFTRSAQLTSKATKTGEATAAAQNIQEIIEAKSVDAMLGQMGGTGDTAMGYMVNEPVLQLIYGDDYTTDIGSTNTIVKDYDVDSTDTEKSVIINGIKSGKRTFNAKVIFDPKATSDLEAVNNLEIAQYTDMAGTFSQPYDANRNPDDIVDNEFRNTSAITKSGKSYTLMETGTHAVLNGQQIIDKGYLTSKSRTIKVSVWLDEEDSGDGYRVYTTVTFNYTYKFSNSVVYLTTLGTEIKPRSWSGTRTFDVFPSGYHIDTLDDKVSCFLYYYAFYESSPESITVDVNSSGSQDINFQLFLVKQWPMVTNNAGEKVLAASNDPLIINEDSQYTINLTEIHNNKFTIQKGTNGYAEDSQRSVYTNANIPFDTSGHPTPNKYVYTLRARTTAYFNFVYGAEAWNRLVEKAKENRYYDVTIEIYDSSVDIDSLAADSGVTPIYQFKANKLK